MSTVIVHDIDEWALDDILIAGESSDDLTILLDSYGGDLYSGYAIYDYLKSKPNAKVKVIGNCMSAASLVLLGCKPENRTASEHAQFMIHRPLLFWFGTLTQNEAHAVDADIEKETLKLVNVYKRELPISEATIYAMLDNEQIIGSATAEAFGFVSAIEMGGLENKGKPTTVAGAKADKSGMQNSQRGKAILAELEHNKQLIFNQNQR